MRTLLRTALTLALGAGLAAVADVLATVVAQRATAAGGTFVDARGPYSGHEVCSSSPWINGTTWPVTDSYHPNRSGYSQGCLPMLRGVVT